MEPQKTKMADMKTVLLASEAELYVQELKAFPIAEIGSPKWLTQHELVEKLNMQAIICASTQIDEFIKDYLITLQKIPVLIHELIAIEMWKFKVFPTIIEQDFDPASTLPLYFALFHEATLIGLLETIMYHRESCEAAEESILDLLDFCHRKCSYLISRQEELDDNEPNEKPSKDDKNLSIKELSRQHNEIKFTVCVKAVSILNYITEHINSLSFSVLTRMLNTHDMPLVLVQLVENPPWSRKTKQGKLEKFIDTKWRVVPERDRLQLTKTDGQVWLALFNLLLKEDCQRKYELNDYKKAQILKLRGHLNEVLLDQVPSLVDLQRYLEHLAIMEPPAIKKDLILEQLPEIRESLLKENAGKWEKIAQRQARDYFSPSEKEIRKQAQNWAATYNLDAIEDMINEQPKCSTCGQPAAKRCSRCQNVWYCKRECQVKDWNKHKAVCNLVSQQK
ncbi:hypothetical protein QZH41_016547 [Actinostola sp. cb2023]|nr:hypothetical protein QZH41_016547 [Actinostola sp. cb2023]